jgi:peptide/nickel transport system permease protein
MYVLRRLLFLIPVLLGLTMLTFILSNVVTDPVSAYITERTPQSQILQIRKAHHFDDPIPIQYLYYLRSLLSGDWGLSKSMSMEPVSSVIARLFPATMELAVAAVIFEVAIGLPIGIISAVKKDKWPDHTSRLLALSGTSFPIFWLGLIMQYLFFYDLKLAGLPFLPSQGRVDEFVLLQHPLHSITGLMLFDSLVTFNIPVFLSALSHIILPAIVLGFDGLGIVIRITRSSMLEVLRQDYITLARAKGLSERIVIYKHALKNALTPIITIVGVIFGFTLSGAAIVETIFSWPGMGRWAALAILSLDQASIMAFVIVSGLIYLLVNLVVDVMYSLFDPRIRYG